MADAFWHFFLFLKYLETQGFTSQTHTHTHVYIYILSSKSQKNTKTRVFRVFSQHLPDFSEFFQVFFQVTRHPLAPPWLPPSLPPSPGEAAAAEPAEAAPGEARRTAGRGQEGDAGPKKTWDGVEFSFMEILEEYRYPYYLSVCLSVYLSICLSV